MNESYPRLLHSTDTRVPADRQVQCVRVLFCNDQTTDFRHISTVQQRGEWTRPREDSSPGDPTVPHVWPPWRRWPVDSVSVAIISLSCPGCAAGGVAGGVLAADPRGSVLVPGPPALPGQGGRAAGGLQAEGGGGQGPQEARAEGGGTASTCHHYPQ